MMGYLNGESTRKGTGHGKGDLRPVDMRWMKGGRGDLTVSRETEGHLTSSLRLVPRPVLQVEGSI